MDYMNAFFVPAAALVVRRTGGMQTNIWDQPFFYSLIGLFFLQDQLFSEHSL